MAKRMLPVPHFQVVCTLPSALRAVARARPAEVYGLLMQTAARVLKELVAERHGVRPGLTVVLHTWTTTLEHHPHVHLLVSAGGLDPDDAWRGIEGDYLLPQRKLGACFRGALLRALIDDVGNWELESGQEAQFRQALRKVSKRNRRGWVSCPAVSHHPCPTRVRRWGGRDSPSWRVSSHRHQDGRGDGIAA